MPRHFIATGTSSSAQENMTATPENRQRIQRAPEPPQTCSCPSRRAEPTGTVQNVAISRLDISAGDGADKRRPRHSAPNPPVKRDQPARLKSRNQLSKRRRDRAGRGFVQTGFAYRVPAAAFAYHTLRRDDSVHLNSGWFGDSPLPLSPGIGCLAISSFPDTPACALMSGVSIRSHRPAVRATSYFPVSASVQEHCARGRDNRAFSVRMRYAGSIRPGAPRFLFPGIDSQSAPGSAGRNFGTGARAGHRGGRRFGIDRTGIGRTESSTFDPFGMFRLNGPVVGEDPDPVAQRDHWTNRAIRAAAPV